MFQAFDEVFSKDRVPYIDTSFKAIPDREHRALAGLSRGGGQPLNFGLAHLDTFAWGFSSALNTKTPAQLVPNPAEARERLKLLWISCGNKDGLLRISQGAHSYVPNKFDLAS